jgi:hypothetical protein
VSFALFNYTYVGWALRLGALGSQESRLSSSPDPSNKKSQPLMCGGKQHHRRDARTASTDAIYGLHDGDIREEPEGETEDTEGSVNYRLREIDGLVEELGGTYSRKRSEPCTSCGDEQKDY